MSCRVQELQEWLSTLPPTAAVAIDEGGLTLVEVGGDGYFEIGGEPETIEEDS